MIYVIMGKILLFRFLQLPPKARFDKHPFSCLRHTAFSVHFPGTILYNTNDSGNTVILPVISTTCILDHMRTLKKSCYFVFHNGPLNMADQDRGDDKSGLSDPK